MTGWKRADMHVHTSFSGWRQLRLIRARDCYVTPDEAFAAARRRGMDFVCFTDHDTIDGALDFLARHPEAESRLIIGEELEIRLAGQPQWFHLGVYGIDEAIHADLMRLREDGLETICYLRERGILFALNHPFQSLRSATAARRHLGALLPLIPAVETLNSTSPRSHQAVLESLAAGLGTGSPVQIGGSDAHTVRRIAAAYTAAPATSKEEFLGSIRAGTCAVGGETLGLAALMGDVHHIIGRYYGDLYRPGRLHLAARDARNLLGSLVLLPAVVLGLPAALTLLHTVRQVWIGHASRWARHDRAPLPLPEAGSIPQNPS